MELNTNAVAKTNIGSDGPSPLARQIQVESGINSR
jgi:hypothetical protein